MYSYPRAILYAIILWGLTFLAGFFIYPLRAENPMLFASVRMVIVALISMVLTIMYFRDVEDHLIRDGIKLGTIWLLATIILDQGPFVWGLMQFSFVDYLADTGVSHLIYPIVTIGAGFLLSADKNTVEDSEAPEHASRPSISVPPGSKDTLSGQPPGPKVQA